MPCPYCSSDIPPVRDGLCHYTKKQKYICRVCGRRYTEASTGRVRPSGTKRVKTTCLHCGKETFNPKFCSSSCAAAYNNSHFPKRKPKDWRCKHCGVPIPRGRSVCDKCNPYVVDWSKRTLRELQQASKYQISAQIRDLARDVYAKSNLPRACRNCGYDKHVEICHVHPISSSPDNTPVAVVNDLANLVALCPNCHWEFDHGLLVL